MANGRLFSGSYDGTVRVWDIETLACLRTLAGHTGPVRTLVYSAGHMFSGSYDKTVRTPVEFRSPYGGREDARQRGYAKALHGHHIDHTGDNGELRRVG